MYDEYLYWYNKTDRDAYPRSVFHPLRRQAYEHYKFLQRISEREYAVGRLAEAQARKENDPEGNESEWAKKTADALANLVVALEWAELSEEEKEKRKIESEKRTYAAKKWLEQRERIDELRKKGGSIWKWNLDPEEFKACQELERVKEKIMTSSYDYESDYHFEGWDEEHELKSNFENFLWDISDAHCSLRCDLDGNRAKSEIQDNVDRYLANPSWHSLMLTDFLLVDFFDVEMLLLEGEFQLGYFPNDVRNKIGNGIFSALIDPASYFSWTLRPNERKKRYKWRVIPTGLGLGFILSHLSNIIEHRPNTIEPIPNGGFPFWAWDVITCVGYFAFACGILSVLVEWIDKNRKVNRKIIEAVAKFVMIRDEISKGSYYPARLIERLKQLEDLNLIVPSVIYPLLELRRNQCGDVNSAH